MIARISAGLAVLGLVLLLGGAWYHRRMTRFDEAIALAASSHELDFRLVKALVFEESRFRPGIRGSAGEFGLMQITQAAAADYAAGKRFPTLREERLLEPRLNLEIGCWYLRRSLDRYKTSPHPRLFALLRYNAGETRTDSWLRLATASTVPEGVSPESHYLSFVDFPKTREYVRRILARAEGGHFWF